MPASPPPPPASSPAPSAPSAPDAFRWPETGGRLRALLRRADLSLAPGGGAFCGPEGERGAMATFTPPLVQRVPPSVRRPQDYLAWLPDHLGLQLVVLLQAGAAAAGVWRDDELLAHKAIKKYVVRGSGRAQPTHLKTKGKSRYGSRLRLRNAQALLVELNEKLTAWRRELGAFDQVWYSCPVRTWAEVLRTEPPPPFRKEEAQHIPRDVAVPTFEELQRVRGFLTWGRIERAERRS